MTGKVGGSAKHQYEADQKRIPDSIKAAGKLSKRINDAIAKGMAQRESQGDPKLQKKIDKILQKIEALEKERAAAEKYLKSNKSKYLKELAELIPIEEDKNDAKGTPEEKKLEKLYETAVRGFLNKWSRVYGSIYELEHGIGHKIDALEKELKKIPNQSR